MKFIPIIPVGLLKAAYDNKTPSIGFALAQYVLQDLHYAYEMANIARQSGFIIMDNGAAEGALVSLEDLARAANLVQADEVALPDVLHDSQGTLKATLDPDVLNTFPPYQRMVIPQGDTWSSYERCLDGIEQAIEYRSIGVPKHLEALPGGRVRALELIKSKGIHLRRSIHLLGIHNDPKQEILRAYQVCPQIRSVDSGVCVANAQNGKNMDCTTHYSLDWTASAPADLMRDNIEYLKNWAMKEIKLNAPKTTLS